MKTPSQQGKASKRKGRAFEQRIARELREMTPELSDDIRRGTQSREGTDEPDVVFWDLWIECKDRKEECSIQALRQAEEASDGSGLIPVAVTKLPRKRPVATLSIGSLTTLLGCPGSEHHSKSTPVSIAWDEFKEILAFRFVEEIKDKP